MEKSEYEHIVDWLIIRANLKDCSDPATTGTHLCVWFNQAAAAHEAEGVETTLIALQPPTDAWEIIEGRGLWEMTFLAQFTGVHPGTYQAAQKEIETSGKAISATIETAWVEDRDRFFASPMTAIIAELAEQSTASP